MFASEEQWGGAVRKPLEEQFAGFLADAPIACHEIDVEGRVVRVSQEECRMLGVPPAEILGRFVWEFVAPAERQESIAAVQAKLAGVRPLTCFEREYVRPDGKTLVVEIREALIRDACGQITGIRSFLADITDRKRAEQALEESDARLRHLIENATDILYEADLHGCFTFVNSTAARILKYPVSRLVGMHYLELIRPDWRNRAHQFYRTQVVNHLPNTYFEFPTLAADGSEVWFGQNVQLIFEHGRLTGVQAMARDITDRKRAEQALLQAQEGLEQRVAERTSELALLAESLRHEVEERRIAEEERRRLEAQVQYAQHLESLGVLAGGLAHDFNNLLTTIIGHAALALLEVPPDSAAAESLEEVQNASNRAADLVQKMLAYSGRGRLIVEPVRLSDLTQDMQDFLQGMISKRAKLMLEPVPGLPEIQADPGQLRQILINVVANAAEALGNEPGTIRVSTGLIRADRELLSQNYVLDRPEGRYVLLQVSDTGCGMDAESKSKIFDPFFSTKFTGRGLGMAAVLGIVRSHGGTIGVESEPGKGTTIRMLFPVPESGQESGSGR